VKKEKTTPEGVKTTYRQIIDGDIEPQGEQKGWKNLEAGRLSFNQMDEAKRREICRKGAAAVHKLHGEKKTARQSLERVLTLRITDDIADAADVDPSIIERLRRDNPNATLYDLIQAVAVGRAVGGSIPAMQYVRDTHGDAPIKQIEVTDNITTDEDRALMRSVAARLENADSIQIVADITPKDVKTDDDSGAT